ncbi:unnamed protein product [Rhizophagus irregularis]|uniref:Uncharacterized protein n=1 Tax=Rhizophagus irregularis TaxID=588596 RepID=A0A915ZIW7_9GLOM|nr:unnamed protein product [Rhizophagus irregularis]
MLLSIQFIIELYNEHIYLHALSKNHQHNYVYTLVIANSATNRHYSGILNSFENDGISWRVKRTHIVVNKVNKYILNYLLGISHGFVLTKPLSDGCKSHSLITRSRTLQRYFGYSKVSSPFPKMVESHGRSNASYCRR